MANKALRFCLHPGCNALTTDRYCSAHQSDENEQRALSDKKRGNANQRGYTYRWSKYSKWFLSQPGNQICKLHLEGCTIVAECVDHIIAVTGPDDPNFFKRENHQSSCLRCNTKKGKKTIKGNYEM
jgi:5-methylcytosine-specific restriction enzyme A